MMNQVSRCRDGFLTRQFPRIVFHTVSVPVFTTNPDGFCKFPCMLRFLAYWTLISSTFAIEDIDHRRHDPPTAPSSTRLKGHPKVQMSPAASPSHEIDTPRDNVYSASILIANLSSPSDYHVLESAIRNATRSTKDRLTVILHSSAFANQEDSGTNWFEIQRLLTWTYVESTAIAQDMDKVLLDTVVLLRPPRVPAAEGITGDEGLVKKADAVYVFEDGAPQFLSEGLSCRSNDPVYRVERILMVGLEVLQPHLHFQTHVLGRVTHSSPTRRG